MGQIDHCRLLLAVEAAARRSALRLAVRTRQGHIDRLMRIGVGQEAAECHAQPGREAVLSLDARLIRVERAIEELDNMVQKCPDRLENDPELVQKVVRRAGVS